MEAVVHRYRDRPHALTNVGPRIKEGLGEGLDARDNPPRPVHEHEVVNEAPVDNLLEHRIATVGSDLANATTDAVSIRHDCRLEAGGSPLSPGRPVEPRLHEYRQLDLGNGTFLRHDCVRSCHADPLRRSRQFQLVERAHYDLMGRIGDLRSDPVTTEGQTESLGILGAEDRLVSPLHDRSLSGLKKCVEILLYGGNMVPSACAF
jgi:hypothetical protein